VSYIKQLSDIYIDQINEGFRGMSYDSGTNKTYTADLGRHSYRKGDMPFNKPSGASNQYAHNALNPQTTIISSDEEESVSNITGTIDKQKIINYIETLLKSASAEGMDYASFQLSKLKSFIADN
jgi:hypothetical protein